MLQSVMILSQFLSDFLNDYFVKPEYSGFRTNWKCTQKYHLAFGRPRGSPDLMGS